MIGGAGRAPSRDKVGSAVAVVAIHLGLGLWLVNGLDVHVPERATTPLSVFAVPPNAPPPLLPEPVVRAEKPRDTRPAGGASPVVALRAPGAARSRPRTRSTPTASPSPPAEMADSAGSGSGDGVIEGTGAGGVGQGAGERAGSGAGSGGGVATGARRLGGRIRDSDYPRAALGAGLEGTVFVRFTVAQDGRVGGCTITRSSGSSELDATTCRLIERRYRYDPARDVEGRPVAVEIVGRQNWWIPRGRGARDDRAPWLDGDAERADPTLTDTVR